MQNFSQSEYFGQLRGFSIDNNKIYSPYALKDIKETVYLPFEKIELPAPAGFENCLTAQYGDWRKLIFRAPHTPSFSADVSYKDFFDKIRFVR